MLAIRLQRTGRKGHAQYRVVVQDSRRSPLSGNVVVQLGSYNPHTKVAQIDTEKAQKYLNDGAQPSDRIAKLLKSEGVKLPKWVEVSTPGKRKTRNPEKLRRNQPEKPAEEKAEEPKTEEVAEAPVEEKPTEEAVSSETPDETTETAKTKEASEEQTSTSADADSAATKPE